jgi:uncharacterized RDD family membrane protein YckC
MSMPQGGESRLPQETGGQAEASAQQRQGNVPGQGGTPGPDSAPGQQWAGGPQNQQNGTPPQGGMPGDQWEGPMQGRPVSPVNEIETRVTGRRTVQYIIDAIIYGIVVSILGWALNRGHGGLHAILAIVWIVAVIAWYVLYWAWRPKTRNGQTFGMQIMGVRVISANGGPASLGQLIGRSILLVLFSPISLLVGIITMWCSRYRQRVGDHLAKTMVVRDRVQPIPAQQEYAGAGQAGYR